MKYKYKIGDWIINNSNNVGVIKSYETSYIDNRNIPSYSVLYALSVYPDGCERNTWESSIKRKLPFYTVWWLIIKNTLS